MRLVDDIVSGYKREMISPPRAVEAIERLVVINSYSEDEDEVPAGNRIIVPREQTLAFQIQMMNPPPRSSQPASTISPETTVWEAVAHASGTQFNRKAVGTVWVPVTIQAPLFHRCTLRGWALPFRRP